MKRSNFSLFVLCVMVFTLAYPVAFADAQAGPQFSVSSVYLMEDQTDVTNAYSILMRGEEEIAMMVHAESLTPNDAVTVWWVIFNNPDACSDPCNSDDFPQNGGDPDVQAAQMFADGSVVDADGRASFGAHLTVGDTSRAYSFETAGLQDVENADVHLVLRTHGQVLPDLLDAQVNTLNGGCENGSEATGTPGPNTCANLMASIHSTR